MQRHKWRIIYTDHDGNTQVQHFNTSEERDRVGQAWAHETGKPVLLESRDQSRPYDSTNAHWLLDRVARAHPPNSV